MLVHVGDNTKLCWIWNSFDLICFVLLFCSPFPKRIMITKIQSIVLTVAPCVTVFELHVYFSSHHPGVCGREHMDMYWSCSSTTVFILVLYEMDFLQFFWSSAMERVLLAHAIWLKFQILQIWWSKLDLWVGVYGRI